MKILKVTIKTLCELAEIWEKLVPNDTPLIFNNSISHRRSSKKKHLLFDIDSTGENVEC